MSISGIKTEQLSIGELLSASFSVWLRTVWSTFKVSTIFFIVGFGVLFGAVLSYAYMPQMAAFAVIISTAFLAILAYSFSVFVFTFSAEDTVNGVSSSVIENLARVYSSLHILLGASIIVALVFMICFLPAVLFKSPIVVLPTILLMFILYVIVMPFISFFPMAVLLRGAGVIDSLKYSYYMVKGRWLKVFGWILLVGIINMITSLIFSVGLKTLVALFSTSAKNVAASVLMGGGVYGIVFMLLAFVFALLFVSLLFYSFMMVAMTVMFLNLEVVSTIPTDSDPAEEDEEFSDGKPLNVPEPSNQPHEITEMFKNIKAVDVNVSTNTERRTALGRLNREEALRQFKKDDQVTFPPLSATPVVPVNPTVSAQSVVNIPEDFPAAPPPPPAAQNNASSDGGGMPTITVRQRVEKPRSFPSVYKPEDRV